MSNVFADAVGSVAGWYTNTFGAGAGQTARGKADDAALAALNTTAYAPGGATYSAIAATQGQDAADAAWTKVQSDLSAQEADTASYSSQIDQAAQDGANQGLQNAKGAVNGFFSSLFGLVPFSVWIIGAVALFLWLGGGVWLKGILGRKVKTA